MPTVDEKTAFAERLKFAMKRAPEKMRGATDLARYFNLHYYGPRPVTPQTVHKWLSGRTIPNPEKMHTLAEWLRVNEHWLHYGPPPSGIGSLIPPKSLAYDEKYPLSSETVELASKFETLTPHHRYLVQELIEQFYGANSKEG